MLAFLLEVSRVLFIPEEDISLLLPDKKKSILFFKANPVCRTSSLFGSGAGWEFSIALLVTQA